MLKEKYKKAKGLYGKSRTNNPPKGYIRSLIPMHDNAIAPNIILFKKSLAVETVNTEQVGEVLVFKKNGYYYGHFTDFGFSLQAGKVKDKDLSAVVKAIESFKKSSAESFKDDISKAPKPFKKVISKETVTALKKMSKNLHSRISAKHSDKVLLNISNGIATFADGETTIVSKIKFDMPDINGMSIAELRSVSDELYIMDDGRISDGEEYLATGSVFDMANLTSDMSKINTSPDIEIPITADVLKTLQHSTHAVDHNNPKFELNGLLIDVEDGKGKAVATDTRRLTISKEFKVKGKDGQYIILPNHITKNTTSLAIDSDGSISKSETEEFTLYARNINGRYPDYQRIIPQYPKNKITFNGKELAKILKAQKEVTLEVAGSEMAIYTMSQGEVDVNGKKHSYDIVDNEIGVIKINPTHNNTDERIAVQAKYLLDVVTGEDEITFEYNTPYAPLKITTSNGEITIVMPIATKSRDEVEREAASKQKSYEEKVAEMSAKAEAEQKEREASEREGDGIAYDFLKSLSPQREASARKLLSKLVRADGKVMPYKEFIPMRVNQGYTPHKKEWEEWSRRLDRNVEKSSWVLSKGNSFTTITKTEADFAKYLINNKVTQDSIDNDHAEINNILDNSKFVSPDISNEDMIERLGRGLSTSQFESLHKIERLNIINRLFETDKDCKYWEDNGEYSIRCKSQIDKMSFIEKDNMTQSELYSFIIERVSPFDVTQDAINSIGTEDKHVTIGEVDIIIETQAGTTRSGTDENGNDWSNKMVDDYGYFENTFGNDGDEIDVFISSDADIREIPNKPVFYLKQNHQDGAFDEDKFILGADTQDEAEKVYYRNYESGYKNSGSWHKVEFTDLGKLLSKLSRIYTKRER